MFIITCFINDTRIVTLCEGVLSLISKRFKTEVNIPIYGFIIESMKTKMGKGIAGLTVAQLLTKIALLILMIYLAKILSPRDFALIGISYVAIGLFDLMSELGLGEAVVQRHKLTQETTDCIFWLTLITGFSLTIVSFLSAPFIELFFKKDGLAGIIRVLSPVMFINSIAAVPYKLIERELRFTTRAWIDLGGKGCAIGAAAMLAFLDFGLWSLIYSQVIGSLVRLIMSFNARPYLPKQIFFYRETRALLSFGSRIIGLRLAWYIRNQVDIFAAGRYLTTITFGYYSFAFQLVRAAYDVIHSVLSTISLPLLSRTQHEQILLKNTFLKLITYTQHIAIPIFVGGILLAEDLIVTIFDAKWLNAVPVFQVACFVALLRLINTVAEEVFISIGKPECSMMMNIYSTFILAIAFYFGVNYGLFGILFVWLTAMPTIIVLWLLFTLRKIDVPLTEYFSTLMPAVTASMFMIGSAYIYESSGIVSIYPIIKPSFLCVAIKGAVCCFGYGMGIIFYQSLSKYKLRYNYLKI